MVEMEPPLTGTVSLLSILEDELASVVPLARGLATRTTSWTDPEAPATRLPMVQVTVPPDGAPPPVAETNEVLLGRVSVMTTPVALALPVLE